MKVYAIKQTTTNKGAINVTRKEKDVIINRLLFVTIFSIVASVVLWFIYGGYLRTKYVLMMPTVVLTIFGLSLLLALVIGWKMYSDKKSVEKFIIYFRTAVVISLGSIAIYFKILYAIYGLWILIAIYLIANFVYNIYKLVTK